MKVSMWSSYYGDLQPEDMVLELEKYGYRFGELSAEHSRELLDRGDPIQVGKAFKTFADTHHVTFSQGHLELSAKICEKEDREFLKRELDLFYGAGVKYAVLHVDMLARYGQLPVQEIRQRNLEGIRDLLDHIRGRDTVICLENIHKKSITESIDDILLLVDELNSDQIGICLDTGHLNLSEDKDQVRFVRKAGRHLKALHLHNNDGSGDQHLMPSARGQVDFLALFAALKEIGYDGLYNLEVPGEHYVHPAGYLPLKLRSIKLEYMMKVCNYYWENC